jgi:N-acetylmuramic acid 6-phosphate etherase
MTKITETKNPLSNNLDNMSVSKIIELMNNEDKEIPKIISEKLDIIKNVINNVINTFESNGRLFYIGCGTSGRLGVLDASECPPTFKINPSLVQGIIAGGYDALYKSIEGAEDSFDDGQEIVLDKNIKSSDSVIGISASGSAQFVLGALSKSFDLGAYTSLITFNDFIGNNSYINEIISYNLGPEIISGSTRMKAGTATKMILNMISTTSMVKSNKVYKNYMVDLKVSNKKLKARAIHIISDITKLSSSKASSLLKLAKNDVKVALVMNHTNLSYDSACEFLELNKGKLRDILE